MTQQEIAELVEDAYARGRADGISEAFEDVKRLLSELSDKLN